MQSNSQLDLDDDNIQHVQRSIDGTVTESALVTIIPDNDSQASNKIRKARAKNKRVVKREKNLNAKNLRQNGEGSDLSEDEPRLVSDET